MATNKIALASEGLLMVGHRPIASFLGPSAGEIAAATLYEPLKDEMLSCHRWSFNKKAVQLSRQADAPATEWDAAYQLPAGIGTVYAVQVLGSDIEFDRYADEIHCNAGTTDVVVLIYGYGADEASWPDYFTTAMRLKLASAFAIPVAGDTEKATLYEGKALRALTNAKTLDSQGRTAAKVSGVGALRRYHRGRP